MFGLKIGDIINTKNFEGWKEFPITMFKEDGIGGTWAILGEPKFLENFGYYGDRMWLIAFKGNPCWGKSKWNKVT